MDPKQALDSVICLLEDKAIPVKPSSPENEKLARKLEADVADYFTAIEQALPMADLEALYLKHAEPGTNG